MTNFWQFLTQLRRALECWVVVQPWEQALRVRLGQRVTRLGPGLHLKVPVVDAIYRQSVRVRWCDLPVQTISTADGKTVTLSVVLGYQIADIERLYQTLHHAEATLRNLTLSAVAEAVHALPSSECTPHAIEDRVVRALDFERFGVADARISVTDFAFVRTFRLIQDTHWGSAGDVLNTYAQEAA